MASGVHCFVPKHLDLLLWDHGPWDHGPAESAVPRMLQLANNMAELCAGLRRLRTHCYADLAQDGGPTWCQRRCLASRRRDQASSCLPLPVMLPLSDALSLRTGG
jgi:hypothetical protein